MKTISDLLATLDEPSPVGDSGRLWNARCPSCGNPNLGVAHADYGILLKCYSGCPLHEVLADLELVPADLLPDGREPSGVTVNRLAFEKRLPAAWLRSYCGLVDDDRRVMIPYLGLDKQLLHRRVRSAVRATDGTRFEVKGPDPAPYGLWLKDEFLARSRDILLV